MMLVDEIMTKNVVTIENDRTVLDACNVYKDRKIGCLIVTKEGHLDGIVTERDIIHRVISNEKDPRATKIEEIMTRDIRSIFPTAEVKEAAEIMSENNIKKLPVVSDSGDVVGIITDTDIANMIPNFLKILAESGDDESFKDAASRFHKATIPNTEHE
jgi:CBS domain-containing protein